MSRIGKQPIALPSGVTINIDGSMVEVKGKKGSLAQRFHRDMEIKVNDGVVEVTRPTDSRDHRALHGLTRALLNNMVTGVSEGFEKRLSIQGVGYRAEMKGSTLVLHVGYSHPVEIEAPDNDTKFAVEERGRLVILNGIDKQVVGEMAAQIRKVRPPEPYKGKGIRYLGEHVRRKAGKAGKV
ncbi:MAG: 50S ribosomal protein L6 [Ardenticatenaceae bacterium]|nr:50S ribosomal protein L6 [Ardenticatenaceae bacterium]